MKTQSALTLSTFLLILACACNPSPKAVHPETKSDAIDEVKETAAIMKVIDGETDCFFKGNYECWTQHWSHEKYAFQAWNNNDGTADAAVGWDKIDAQGKDWINKYYKNGKNVIHPVVKRDKPFVKFFSDKLAYLIWKQYNADQAKTNFRTSQEIRIMEKNEGAWKIVNVSAFWDTQAKIPFDSLQVQ